MNKAVQEQASQTVNAATLAVLLQELQAVEDRQQALKQESGELTLQRTEIMTRIHNLFGADAVIAGETKAKRQLTPNEKTALLSVLERRFEKKPDHYTRVKGINFADVAKALEANPDAMMSVAKMEETGGEPDIVGVDQDGTFLIADCSAESPQGRRNCVYDKEAEKNARGFNGNAVDMAKEFGVALWSLEFYRAMQQSGKFDRNTWSWVETDAETRKSGGALIGYRRDDVVGVHRYDARDRDVRTGWRGVLRVKKA